MHTQSTYKASAGHSSPGIALIQVYSLFQGDLQKLKFSRYNWWQAGAAPSLCGELDWILRHTDAL